MKKIILLVALLVSIVTFAQKDELKTLKKIYAKDMPSSSDMVDYKAAIKSLETLAATEEEKVYTNFYAAMSPLMEINSLGSKATLQDQMKIFSPKALDKFSSGITETLEFEKKSKKNIYTEDIEETLGWFVPMLEQTAFKLNEAKQFKAASAVFHNLYKLNKESGANLLNAAILSVQAEDYLTSINLYEEYRDSDYLKNGYIYYAKNKLNDQEETFTSKAARKSKLDNKTYERPRDEKVSGREDILKIIATIKAKNNDIEGAKKAYKDAVLESPDDLNLLIEEANFYYSQNDLNTYRTLIKEVVKKDPTNASLFFNIGYLNLSDDVKLVEEINKNLDNPKVYDELTIKRKAMYQTALPYLEESFKLDSTNADTKTILKGAYIVLGMKEKAEKL